MKLLSIFDRELELGHQSQNIIFKSRCLFGCLPSVHVDMRRTGPIGFASLEESDFVTKMCGSARV